MGVPGASAGPIESMDRNTKKRGTHVTLVVLFSLVLLVGMTKIHASVAGCGDADETGEFEQDVGSTRRMLSAAELSAEAGRRAVLEAETRRMLATSGYFVSYSALSASRVSCPPRSGRSYYTRNWFVESPGFRSSGNGYLNHYNYIPETLPPLAVCRSITATLDVDSVDGLVKLHEWRGETVQDMPQALLQCSAVDDEWHSLG